MSEVVDFFHLGDIVDVYYVHGSDDTPIIVISNRLQTFTGFRIAPE